MVVEQKTTLQLKFEFCSEQELKILLTMRRFFQCKLGKERE